MQKSSEVLDRHYGDTRLIGRMKFFRKYGNRRNEIRRARREFTIKLCGALAVILFLVFMALIGRIKPRLEEGELPPASTELQGDPMQNPRLIELRGKVDSLMEQFRTASLAESGSGPDPLYLLEQAIETQREIIRLRGSEIAPLADTNRLEDLLLLYDAEMGNFLFAQSERLESEADHLWQSGQQQLAISRLEQAINQQRRINRDFPRSEHNNPTRLHLLDNRLLNWQTQPLADRADALRQEAITLGQKRAYGEAVIKARQAMEQQMVINRDHRRSRLASLLRLKQFEDTVTDLEMQETSDRILDLMAQSRAAMEGERADEAVALADEAATLQRKLIADHPSRRARLEATLAEIQQLRDSAGSLPAYLRLREAETATRTALRDRDLAVFNARLADWWRQLQELRKTYPQSIYLGQLDDQEVSFLQERREAIPTILELVYSALVPLPGYPRTYILSTEVPQVLYASVMGLNPSSQKSPELPVDSVTWQEAQAFTRLLGWILARPVALPDRNAYLAALGEPDLSRLSASAWAMENADRQTQPTGRSLANPYGLHDLLGNVAEWLDSTEANPSEVTAIGGTARDTLARLGTLPEESRSPSERNRFIGFRFIISD